MAERITSRTNALMVHIRKLGSSRAHRREAGEYLGDGVKLLDEAVRWGASLTAVVHTADVPLPELGPAVRVAEVPVELMRSISPMETPQGVLFLARQPSQEPPERLSGCRYLALEGVQDPGNVGTILRTADAFGADGLFLLPGCADPFGPKAVRASLSCSNQRPRRGFPCWARPCGRTQGTSGRQIWPMGWPWWAARAGASANRPSPPANTPSASRWRGGANPSTRRRPPLCFCGRATDKIEKRPSRRDGGKGSCHGVIEILALAGQPAQAEPAYEACPAGTLWGAGPDLLR